MRCELSLLFADLIIPRAPRIKNTSHLYFVGVLLNNVYSILKSKMILNLFMLTKSEWLLFQECKRNHF